MGREQTEIDAPLALHPGAIRFLAKQAVKPFYDPTLQQRARQLAAAWTEHASRELLSNESYPAAYAAIEKARGDVAVAVSALEDAQAKAVAMLPRFDGVIAAPAPIIEAAPPDPLFTWRDDYCAASLRLIAAKRLDWSAS
jgi:hypothetical protein